MNITTNITEWFHAHPKAREWAWFVALWCCSLGFVMALAYPIKWLIRSIG